MATRINILTFLFIGLIPVALHSQSLPFACAGSRVAYGVGGYANSIFFWDIDGGTIVSDNNDTIIVEWDISRRTHRLQVTEITETGCTGFPVQADIVVRTPVANIGDEFEVCDNDSVLFNAEISYDTQLAYLWQDGSTGSTFYGKDEGIVWVRISGLDGCLDFDSASLFVNPLPIVNLGRDTTLCGTATLTVNAGSFPQYQWSTNQFVNPVTVGATNGYADTLSVEVTDHNGCKSSDTIVILQCDPGTFFADIPNTIIPNDPTANNQTWRIDHLELFPGAIVEIFDRWGRLIYHTEDPDPQNVWNGKSQADKEMPMDSYYYVIELNYRKVKPLVGTINVIR